ncbi:MAG TPA: hypothetical protein GX734_01355 [Clostridiaceae bacterium]|nr:hypothetical protein [Clostridiaceae bacterium]
MNLDATVRRRVAVYLPGLFLSAFLQISVYSSSAFLSPDFLFLFPLMAGLWSGGYDGFATGLAAGFLRDYLAGRGYGMGMLTGMFIGLLAGWLAYDDWRQYALRGGILVVVGTLLYEMTLSFFVWLFPMEELLTPLSSIWRVALARCPAKLLSNIIGALVLTGYLSLAFYRRKSKRENAGKVEDIRGGESLA